MEESKEMEVMEESKEMEGHGRGEGDGRSWKRVRR